MDSKTAEVGNNSNSNNNNNNSDNSNKERKKGYKRSALEAELDSMEIPPAKYSKVE